MLVRILGDVDVVTQEGPVAIGSRSQRVILAVLASRRGTTVDAGTLIDAVWGDDPPTTAVASLRTYVSRLRRHLGDAVVIEAGGYRLSIGADAIDAERAEALVERSRGLEPSDALPLLAEALELWRGPALSGLDEVETLRGTATRLDELKLAAQEARIGMLVGAGRAPEAVRSAEDLVAEVPLRESVWSALTEALIADGRHADALRAVQRAAAALGEAGLVPSAALRSVEQRALADDSPVPAPRSLPVTPDELVGRDDLLDELVEAMASERLITLVGPGGVGKTRVALEVARRAGARHRWGARVVQLAGVSDESAVLAAVSGDLGLTGDPAGDEATVGNAASLDLLVVLDNCEHVVDAAARAASILTTAGTRARVLATSRSPLEIAGERVWPVGALTSTSAADLFVRRARAARPDLEGAATDIAQIVELVDGLPLAVEMAAAQARHVPVPELRRRLEDEITSLRSTRRDADHRHRTIAAVVEWSERLLDEDEHRLFRAMSMVEGRATASDVERFSGEVDAFEVLSRLADRSLLTVDTDARSTRFGMLRTVRSQARARLGARPEELARLTAAHAAWMVDAVTDEDHRLRFEDEPRADERLSALLDDARVAFAWCRHHDPSGARRICAALYPWAQSRLRDEVLGWAELLADDEEAPLDPSQSGDDALVLCAASFRAASRGDVGRAADLADRAGATSDMAALPYVREMQCDAHLYVGDLARGAEVAVRGVDEATAVDDGWARATNVIGVALAASYGGDHESAAAVLDVEPAWPMQPSARAWLSYARGEVVLDRDPDTALRHLGTAIDLAEGVGNLYVSGVARVSVASLRARTGDVEDATTAFAGIIRHWRGRGDHTHQLTTLRNLVTLLMRRGEPERAALLLGAIDDALVPSYGDEADRLDAARRAATEALGEDKARDLMASGAALDLDGAAVTALEWLDAEHVPRDV